jgi:hypothetical protein
MNSATIGIFNKTISQMKVHVVTYIDRIPAETSVQPPDHRSGVLHRLPRRDQPLSASGAPLNSVIACSSRVRVTISAPVSRSTRSVPNSSTLNDASTVA